MITEQEAQKAVLALGTAMIHEDKEGREAVYADLDNDSLRRIIRWAMRQNLSHFATVAMMVGENPIEAWTKFAMAINLALDEQEDNE